MCRAVTLSLCCAVCGVQGCGRKGAGVQGGMWQPGVRTLDYYFFFEVLSLDLLCSKTSMASFIGQRLWNNPFKEGCSVQVSDIKVLLEFMETVLAQVRPVFPGQAMEV